MDLTGYATSELAELETKCMNLTRVLGDSLFGRFILGCQIEVKRELVEREQSRTVLLKKEA